jgi:hypothetical protein
VKVRLVVPGRPPALNELLGHWGKAHRLKADWTQRVMVAKSNLRTPKATERRRVDILVALGKGKRKTDPDALWKASLDALKLNGLLVDDSPTWCEMGTVRYVAEKERDALGWTEYTLTEVRGEPLTMQDAIKEDR